VKYAQLHQPVLIPGNTSAGATEGDDRFGSRFALITFGTAILSASAWLAATGTRANGNLAAICIFGVLAILIVATFAIGRTATGLMLIAYLAALQPAARLYGTSMPYFALEYLLPISAVLLVLRKRGRIHLGAPFLLYGGYISLELLGIFATDLTDIVRGVLVPSLTLWMALFIAAQLRLTRQQLVIVCNGYIVGAISLAALIGRVYTTGQIIRWTTESNFTASGGMGPVQVGLLLAIACFMCLIVFEHQRGLLRFAYIAICFVLTYIMVLTFARGGLYIFGAATLSYYLFLRRPDPRRLAIVIACCVSIVAIFQFAAETTEGAVIDRYSERNTSNRLRLFQHGWEVFLNHSLFGVGTSNYHKVVSESEYFGRSSGAHNELIRAAAEHGVVGLGLWMAFVITTVRAVLQAKPGAERALCLIVVGIALVSTFYNGLKLAGQSLLFLLALALAQRPANDAAESVDNARITSSAGAHL
jgi:O-antigen ligase